MSTSVYPVATPLLATVDVSKTPSDVITQSFDDRRLLITLSVQLCVQRDGID